MGGFPNDKLMQVYFTCDCTCFDIHEVQYVHELILTGFNCLANFVYKILKFVVITSQ